MAVECILFLMKTTMTVHITKSKRVEVTTYAEASHAVCAHWNDRSSSAFYRDARAGIVEVDGEAVAHVSYNGRVWSGIDRLATGKTEIGV